MNSIFSELKKAREAKHLTLADISDATSINIRFLEAIEQGNFSILPEPYIRAFIREYASLVDLDAAEMLKRYEEMTGAASTPAEPKSSSPEPAREAAPTLPPGRSDHGPINPRLARYAILSIALIVISIGLWNLWRSPGKRSPTEIPITPTIQERENRRRASSDVVRDSSRTTKRHQTLPSDSLSLSARVLDSTWIMIQIDRLPARDYLLKPSQKLSWKAREKFLVTLGNAGGVEFTLNQKRLGTLGKRGAIIRDVELSRQLLRSER